MASTRRFLVSKYHSVVCGSARRYQHVIKQVVSHSFPFTRIYFFLYFFTLYGKHTATLANEMQIVSLQQFLKNTNGNH